jgi:hypothetical protein
MFITFDEAKGQNEDEGSMHLVEFQLYAVYKGSSEVLQLSPSIFKKNRAGAQTLEVKIMHRPNNIHEIQKLDAADKFECQISGDFTIENLFEILKSDIYTGQYNTNGEDEITFIKLIISHIAEKGHCKNHNAATDFVKHIITDNKHLTKGSDSNYYLSTSE